MGDELNKFIEAADAKSKFIRFEDGKEVIGVYQGAKVIPDNFNKEEQTVEYSLGIGDVKKTFTSKSVRLARLLNNIELGQKIKLVKTGTGFDTKWYVKNLNEGEDEAK